MMSKYDRTVRMKAQQSGESGAASGQLQIQFDTNSKTFQYILQVCAEKSWDYNILLR